MCGIAGVVTQDRREAEAAIGRMVPAMVHRGPDDGGQEILPVAGMGAPAFAAIGFRRLSILDLSPAGHQPMCDPETGNVLVFNGEIYNFVELRTQLQAMGVHFRGTSDTEVLLHALGRWGDAALSRLEGMYALAFHRARDHSLLLARDPLGIKPLYAARPGGRLVFASEIRTILASGLVLRDIDVAGITGMLAFGSAQAPRTVFAAIEEFPAGHAQWIGGAARRFWSFPTVRSDVGDDPVATTSSLVHSAVRRHLVADVPVGVFLSAGIDSTIVAACAAEVASSVTAFTVGIGPRHPDDETAVAAATARGLGMRHEILSIDERALPSLWHDWVESLDSPSIDGFNTWLVTKGLADRGLKVGLSGLGADELFGGYTAFRRVPRMRRLMTALSFLPAGVTAAVAERCLAGVGKHETAEKVSDLLRGGRDAGSIALATRRVLSDRRLQALGLLAKGAAVPGAEATPDPGVPRGDDFNAVSRVEVAHYMRNTLLRDSDANSMSHSLELRVPFLDQPLADYALGLPGRVKLGAEGAGKHLLRAAFCDRLPKVVTGRSKTGFTLPIGEWMRAEMRPFCEEAIAFVAGLACLDGDAVMETWRRYLERRERSSWARPFALVILGDYLRRHAGTGKF